MKRLKCFRSILILAACMGLASQELHAQESPESSFTDRAPAGAILRDTIAVAEVDLSAIDVAGTFNVLNAAGAGLPPQAQTVITAHIKRLRDAGVTRIYATLPSRWIVKGGVCVFIPCRDAATVERLVSGVVPKDHPLFTVIQRDAMVIVCPTAAAPINRSREGDAAADTQATIDAAIASVDSLPHRAVIAIPEDLRREIALLWPQEMKLIEGVVIAPSDLMREIRSVAVGVGLPPKLQLEMQVICQSPAGAEVVGQQLNQLVRAIPEGISRPEVKIQGNQVTVALSVDQIQTIQAVVLGPARERADHQRSMSSFKQLGIALHNYHDTYQHFPGKYTVNADRRPLLSWRVALLPYMEEITLYEKFKQDEPWDSPHNRALIAEMPEIFAVVGDSLPEGQSRIRLPIIDASLWDGEGPPRQMKDVRDGTSNTIWVAVAPVSAAVEWTKPDDWQLDAENIAESLFGDAESVIVGILDGSVRTISRSTSEEILKALLTFDGGEVIDND